MDSVFYTEDMNYRSPAFESAIIILLIPLTWFVGGIYKWWVWGLLPSSFRIATYAEGLITALPSLITILVTLALFRKFKSRLLPSLRSELLILLIFWTISIIILMNPFTVAGFDWLLRHLTGDVPLPPRY